MTGRTSDPRGKAAPALTTSTSARDEWRRAFLRALPLGAPDAAEDLFRGLEVEEWARRWGLNHSWIIDHAGRVVEWWAAVPAEALDDEGRLHLEHWPSIDPTNGPEFLWEIWPDPQPSPGPARAPYLDARVTWWPTAAYFEGSGWRSREDARSGERFHIRVGGSKAAAFESAVKALRKAFDEAEAAAGEGWDLGAPAIARTRDDAWGDATTPEDRARWLVRRVVPSAPGRAPEPPAVIAEDEGISPSNLHETTRVIAEAIGIQIPAATRGRR